MVAMVHGGRKRWEEYNTEKGSKKVLCALLVTKLLEGGTSGSRSLGASRQGTLGREAMS